MDTYISDSIGKTISMDEEVKNYLTSGKILAAALKIAADRIHVGMPIKELCNIIEGYIVEHAALAFPCNISINNIAAHDTADINDQRTIPSDSIVKIDAGVHVNGYIADGKRFPKAESYQVS